jgi:hypothetical protein
MKNIIVIFVYFVKTYVFIYSSNSTRDCPEPLNENSQGLGPRLSQACPSRSDGLGTLPVVGGWGDGEREREGRRGAAQGRQRVLKGR